MSFKFKWVKVITVFAVVLLTAGCLTTTEKEPIASPWTPEMSEDSAARIKPPVDEVVPFYFVEDAPVIDGEFEEWEGLDGAVTRIVVLGSVHDPVDAEARFVLKTDGENLYIFADVTDDIVNQNGLAGSMAWRGDSVEVFVGTDTSFHEKFNMGDNHIRIVPKNLEDPFDFELSVNDVSKASKTRAAIVITDSGYRVEASLPLALLQIKELKPGQKLKCEFQVNDGDNSERDRMVHWMSETDNPWNNPSVWGRGEVIKGDADAE